MPKAEPIGILLVRGRNNVPVELDMYAETEWLAVTREKGQSFAVTHKPTGMIVTRTASFVEAKRVLKKISTAQIDWNWGQNWSARVRHSAALMKRDKKCAAARQAYIELVRAETGS
jgi:hypothetical protein